MKIKKSLKNKLEELDLALKALKNSNDNYIKTKDKSYLLDMMGRLRALIGLGSWNMKPLLINLSKELEIPLELFAPTPLEISNSEKLAGSITIGKTWTTNNREGTQRYILEDWLNTPIYYSETSKHFKTRNQVIKNISNTIGGSHYDDDIPHIVDTLKRISAGNESHVMDGVEMILTDIAPLVYWLGKRLILEYQIKELKTVSIITETFKNKKKLELESEIKKIDEYFGKLQISGINCTKQFFTK